MKHFDLIIAGGGAAGLSLACHLVASALRDQSILVIDQDAKDQNDRTWCFWSARPTLFDDIVYRSWSQLQIAGSQSSTTLTLGTYRYKMLRGIDFYRCAHQRLAAYPNVEFLRGRVDQVWDGDSYARVVVDGQMYAARWVFDSLFTWTVPSPSPSPGLARIPRCGGFHSITQQFQGWEIEAANAAFDPHVASLMDFRTPQAQGLCFLYVLPLSARRAIVEHVQCATAFAQRTARNDAMKAYLSDVLGVADYHIVREEHGFSPLTDRPFCRRAGRHVMTIGIKGGQIKPSTGYAFIRMQDDADAIVQSLLERGHPFHVPRSPRRYRYFDAVLLDILAHRPEQAVPIFTALFRRSPAEQVFRFLDEETSVWENLQMIPTMPPRLVLQAVLDLCLIAHV